LYTVLRIKALLNY